MRAPLLRTFSEQGWNSYTPNQGSKHFRFPSTDLTKATPHNLRSHQFLPPFHTWLCLTRSPVLSNRKYLLGWHYHPRLLCHKKGPRRCYSTSAPQALTSLMTDASNSAVGAVLQQYVNGQLHSFQRHSSPRKLDTAPELLAVYLAIKHSIFSRRQNLPHTNWSQTANIYV